MTTKRLRHLLWAVGVIAAVLSLGYWASRTTAPPLPPGVQKEVLQLTLAGHPVSVTLYYPPHRTVAPMVVVAHGFTRSKRYMAGWGGRLASEGFIAAAPTQPTLVNHEQNAQALADLVRQLRSGKVALKVKPSGRTALMGHSMGGLTTLLAAGKQPVDAWVGLDPVGMTDAWLGVGQQLHIPCAVLRAEPGLWNMDGNARALFDVLPGPKFTMEVIGSAHLDLESPTDVLGQLFCGPADAHRRAVFQDYAIAFLKMTVKDDAASRCIIEMANSDDKLTAVALP